MNRYGLVVTVMLILASTALADWAEGDPHKMHYPQLPDLDGWDVNMTYYVGVADDWRCSQTGPVTDFHIWVSWKGDLICEPEFIHTAIYADDRSGDFSKPAGDEASDALWHKDWLAGEWESQFWGSGDQGWYDPAEPLVSENDHQSVWQYNFFLPESEAFEQDAETIYWLEVSFGMPTNATEQVGWKTSESQQFEDDAVWHIIGNPTSEWQELTDPLEPTQSLDMAFVITPEPATLVLLVSGSIGVIVLRRRHP